MLGFTGADLLEAVGLDQAQQFGLQVQVHFADFIEEQRSAIGLFGGALPFRGSAAEGAFHMPENLRFEQVFRNCRTVDGHERPFVTRAVLVDRGCTEFLACSAFAGDEHTRPAGGHVVDDAVHQLHGPGTADEIGVALEINRIAVFLYPVEQFGLPQGIDHGYGQPVAKKGLLDEVESTMAGCLDGIVDIRFRGDDYRARGQFGPRDLLEDVEATDIR